MGLNLADLAANTATVTPEYGGEECEVTYYPEKLTFDLIESLMGSDVRSQGDAFYEAVAEIIKSWDIISDGRCGTKKGKPLPVRADTAKSLPVKMTTAFIFACIEDTMPGEAQPPSSVG